MCDMCKFKWPDNGLKLNVKVNTDCFRFCAVEIEQLGKSIEDFWNVKEL